MSWIKILKTGDELISAKRTNSLIKHHAVIIRYTNSGLIYVIDNNIGFGVRKHTIMDYLMENNIIAINKFCGTHLQRIAIIKRVGYVLNKSYDLFKFNCEHLSNYLRFGLKESKQIIKVFFILFIFLCITIYLYHTKKQSKYL